MNSIRLIPNWIKNKYVTNSFTQDISIADLKNKLIDNIPSSWTITTWNVIEPFDDSIFHYRNVELIVVENIKESHLLSIVVIGDIEIYSTKNDDRFAYKKGQKIQGSLTPSLYYHGEFVHNNWLQLWSSELGYDDEIFHSVSNSIDLLIEKIRDLQI